MIRHVILIKNEFYGSQKGMGIKMDILPSVEIPTWLTLPDDESEGMRRQRPFGGLRNRSNDDYEDDYDDFDEF